MSSLRKYRVLPVSDAGKVTTKSLTSILHAKKSPISQQEFFDQTDMLLPKLAHVVANEIIPRLEEFDGTWHPSGFMVYQLGEHAKFGTLRLHIWPKQMRKRIIKGDGQIGDVYDGDIHNHAWCLNSFIFTEYMDRFYEVKAVMPPLNDTPAGDVFGIYNVEYDEDVQQVLKHNGQFVRISEAKTRKISKNQLSRITYDIYHAPIVPLNTLGCTLVFDSFRFIDHGPDVLIRGMSEDIREKRLNILPKDARQVKLALLGEIKNNQ